MPVESETNRVEHECNGSLTEFDFTFPIHQTSDIKVYLRESDGTETLLTETTHYSVSATNNDYSDGGTVTTVETYDEGNTLIILRVMDLKQTLDLVYLGEIPSRDLEKVLDKNYMILQQIYEMLKRTVQLLTSSLYEDLTLPDPVADYLLAWRNDLTGLKNVTGANIGDLTVSDWIKNLLDDADAATARATLGAQSSSFKIGTSTRDSSGDQVISGLGFTPRLVIFFATDPIAANANMSNGFDDGTNHYCTTLYDDATNSEFNDNRSIYIRRAVGNYIYGKISALASDQFTITWTLVGTCEAYFTYLALP